MIKYEIPKNKIPFDYLYAVLSRDEDGNEGIVSAMSENGAFPMVFGDPIMLKLIKPLIIQLSKDTGRKLYVMKFEKKEQLEVIDFSN